MGLSPQSNSVLYFMTLDLEERKIFNGGEVTLWNLFILSKCDYSYQQTQKTQHALMFLQS